MPLPSTIRQQARQSLVRIADYAIDASFLIAWERCRALGNDTEEADIVAALCVDGTMMLLGGWDTVLRPYGIDLRLLGVYCHQSPKVRFDDMQHDSCELGEDSAISLTEWLPAFWVLVSAKNGISSCELARSLGVTQKTAWFILHRIRHTLKTGTFEKMNGTVEVDETYIGGLEKNKHKDKKLNAGRGAVGKAAIAAVLERGDGADRHSTEGRGTEA